MEEEYYVFELEDKSNGSPLYFLHGPENLNKKSSKLEVIAKFIINNCELEETKITFFDQESYQAAEELKKVLANMARQELSDVSYRDIHSDWS
ncbi:MAG: hypothetical protein K9M44_01720 [Candidatus Pacebacteria bacterium]|nr:hypothetical protein [Candidatus Paceibacterota bacterium]